MNVYDNKKIGGLIAWKGDHFVYNYNQDKVIKFSKFDYFLGFDKAKQKTVSTNEVCKKYFHKYLLPAEVMISDKGNRIALLQPKISGSFLDTKHLHNQSVREQFRDLMSGYKLMQKDGYARIDLIGQTGAFQRCFSNIFVNQNNDLILFDATMLDTNGFPFWMKPIVYVLFKFALWRQDSNIKFFEKIISKSGD